MPESLVVIGNVDFISAETFSTENVLKSIEQGNHVLLIEGYGVLVLGKSAIQVCFISENEGIRRTTDWKFWKRRAKLFAIVMICGILSWNCPTRRLRKSSVFLEDR